MKYYVNFYDAFDGWGTWGFFPDCLFDSLEEAKAKCNVLQATLDEGNKNMGEHFGVMVDRGGLYVEIYCTRRR